MASSTRSALRRVAWIVGYGVVAALFLGGGVTLRTITDADAASAPRPSAPSAGAAGGSTTTTWLLVPSTTTTVAGPRRVSVASPPTTAAATRVAPPADAPPAAPVAVAPAMSADRRAVWLRLADCESGVWGAGKVPVAGSATWTVVDEVHQGGLQIRAGQWDQHRVRFPAFPHDAHLATPEQQIAVAEVVLAGQGVRAWPTCGPRVGLDQLL